MNKYSINFKWGSEPQKNIKRTGLSKKWYFYKPDCGNLSPSIQAPFSSFTSIPYSGGYPTGYGEYEHCAWSTPKTKKEKGLIGFTHFCYSGSGDLNYFHNYFLIKPIINKTNILKETYDLCHMIIETKEYRVESFINRRAVKYVIDSIEDVNIFPSFNGLITKKYKPLEAYSEVTKKDNIILIKSNYYKRVIYWTLKILNGSVIDVNNELITLSKNTEFILSYSFDSFDDSIKYIEFTESSNNEWIKALDVFDVSGSNKDLFYTALYTCLKKPFIYSLDKVYDFATLWDIYKTLIPLIFIFYKEEAKIIVKEMIKLKNDKGLFYHFNPFNRDPIYSIQAICIINICLSQAKIYGVDFDYETSKELQKNEINYYLEHIDEIKHYTHLLDLSDAISSFYNAYGIDLGLDKIKVIIDNIYDRKKVYLSKKSIYYEGSYANYSFRTSSIYKYRLDNIDLIEKALDKFFGFKGINAIRYNFPTLPFFAKNTGKLYNRFQGLNNEPDMESPYMYSIINNTDKQNIVISSIYKNSFNINDNGVPGNDDNGGLSSWLALSMIGLFPIIGTNKLIIGLPILDKININAFNINVYKENEDSILFDKIILNGKIIKDNIIDVEDIYNKSKLDIYLK